VTGRPDVADLRRRVTANLALAVGATQRFRIGVGTTTLTVTGEVASNAEHLRVLAAIVAEAGGREVIAELRVIARAGGSTR